MSSYTVPAAVYYAPVLSKRHLGYLSWVTKRVEVERTAPDKPWIIIEYHHWFAEALKSLTLIDVTQDARQLVLTRALVLFATTGGSEN